jgi:hypothetical protein
LKRHGIIKQDTKDVDAKIAVLMAEWPKIAEIRVLNNSFAAQDYLSLPQIPSPVATQSTNNLLPLLLGLVFIAFVINLARKHIASEQRHKFFNMISDCINASTINSAQQTQTVALLGNKRKS